LQLIKVKRHNDCAYQVTSNRRCVKYKHTSLQQTLKKALCINYIHVGLQRIIGCSDVDELWNRRFVFLFTCLLTYLLL